MATPPAAGTTPPTGPTENAQIISLLLQQVEELKAQNKFQAEEAAR
jgi:hypothetical protein